MKADEIIGQASVKVSVDEKADEIMNSVKTKADEILGKI